MALAAVALAYAWPMQVTGDNQNAHYALVKALSRAVPYVDETLPETGDLQSHDVVEVDGHVYTVKAPGLAMAAQPAYALVRAVGMRTTGDPMRALWVLTVLTSALATVVLLAGVRALAERIEPGFGTVTAVALGLGALTLPFATLFFSHALGTALVLASFWVLWRERDGLPRLGLVAAGGVLAGLAVTAEHPTMWIVPVLAGYATMRRRRLARLAAFATGTFAGLLPLFAFDLWAFGNPFHTPYDDYWDQQRNFNAFTAPTWDEFARIMFSSLGLLVLAPVLVAGIVGIALLFRRGRRAEAAVCAAVPLVLLAYFSGSGAYGGLGPPRYLTPIMPFVLLPLAATFRRFPLATGVLAAITVFQAVVQTATGPLAAYDGDWLLRARDRDFMATAAVFADVSGWYAIVPFFLAAGAGVLLAVAATRRPELRLADAGAALVALTGWALVAAASTNEWGKEPSNVYVLVAVSVLALPVAIASASVVFRRPPQIAPGT
jgi:hypothetical protein